MRSWAAAALAMELAACGTFGAVEAVPGNDAGVPSDGSPASDTGSAPPEASAPDASSVADVDGGACKGVADCRRYVFVTSETFTGEDLGGAIAADQKCTLRAQVSGDPTIRTRKYKAWLSSTGFEASKRLTHGTRPYVLPDGTLLANDWAQLTAGSLFHAIDRDEGNAPVAEGFVWTGTDIFGNATSSTCAGWSLNGVDNVGTVGRSDAIDSTWTNSGTKGCGTGYRLFCVEE